MSYPSECSKCGSNKLVFLRVAKDSKSIEGICKYCISKETNKLFKEE